MIAQPGSSKWTYDGSFLVTNLYVPAEKTSLMNKRKSDNRLCLEPPNSKQPKYLATKQLGCEALPKTIDAATILAFMQGFAPEKLSPISPGRFLRAIGLSSSPELPVHLLPLQHFEPPQLPAPDSTGLAPATASLLPAYKAEGKNCVNGQDSIGPTLQGPVDVKVPPQTAAPIEAAGGEVSDRACCRAPPHETRSIATHCVGLGTRACSVLERWFVGERGRAFGWSCARCAEWRRRQRQRRW